MFKVSHSKVKTYRRCHYAYRLRYVEKLRRKKKSRPLKFGSIVHEMIEANINGEDMFKVLDAINLKEAELFNSERDMYGEIIEDIRIIMAEYEDKYADDGIRYAKRGGKRAEHEFDLPITNSISLNGKIDAFAISKNDLRWLVEHKTFNHLPNEDERWRNIQSSIYTRVNDIMGWPELDGTMWDYIWSKSPGRPKILKNGELSRSRCNTLPSRLNEVFKEHRLKASDYRSLVKQAEHNRNSYFQRIFNPVKKHTVELVWQDFLITAREMQDNHEKVRAKTIDRHCTWCDYEAICRAELTGGDVDYVKEREYEKSKSKGR